MSNIGRFCAELNWVRLVVVVGRRYFIQGNRMSE